MTTQTCTIPVATTWEWHSPAEEALTKGPQKVRIIEEYDQVVHRFMLTDDATGKIFLLDDEPWNPDWHLDEYPAEKNGLILEELDPSHIFPAYDPSTMTKYQGPVKGDPSVFIKTQQTLKRKAWTKEGCPDKHAQLVRREVSRCEFLFRAPSHHNIAQYKGVVVDAWNRVTGIAYKRYSMDLCQYVRSKHTIEMRHVEQICEFVQQGVDRLHSLGMVHCDLRPPNVFITVDEDGSITEVVAGDFDAMHRVGESIALKSPTGHKLWWPKDVQWGDAARVEIDGFALKGLRRWLTWIVEGGDAELDEESKSSLM
ncbi:hypothetical protein P153DRAFT_388040 [Dothidotthia symphoricarpi CBS 119687]|uniref:Protein kinase domain-containing protein n=1 Tax=Dothidotthia symphoricarpi CBS 119687 TaxID=1392245 RepID=A0A6A6A6D5_9PLEO|nr:uncharacterized protein P153DRAFT_388040 [Dothidotthia symphoricarpi CBS 119687]KAF2126713.1 hypothetical protein P153DRAFT_388040 [Dothidotthia symphoricarpi CBS 119687]